MKLRGILRFELATQLRRPWPWLAFIVLVVFAFLNTRIAIVPATLPEDFILNSPFTIAAVSVFSCMIWLLVASPMAGEAGARDVHAGIHPLLYAAPVSKAEYLGGRLLAAFLLNAFVLLGVQVGSLLAAYAPGIAPEIIGPFRPAAYLAAYAFIALPNAFIASTVQFAGALLTGRAMAAYVGSVFLLFLAGPVSLIVSFPLREPALGKMIDPIGIMGIMNAMMLEWTIVEKNVRMFTLEGAVLWNRLLWLGIATATFGFTYVRFRFAHRTAVDISWSRFARRSSAKVQAPTAADLARAGSVVARPDVRQTFGVATQVRQMLAITAASFKDIATSLPGLFLLVAFPIGLMLLLPLELRQWDVPLVPRTGYVLTKYLTGSLHAPDNYWLIVPLLIIYFAGELVWRERDAGLGDSVDATAVPEWALYLGKFAGLGLILATLMAAVTLAGLLAQTLMGHHDFQAGLYLTVLFGLQLPDYLLFAALIFLVQAAVNQKYVAQLVALLVYFCLIFASVLGVEHNLLVYGRSPGWNYTDIRGFGVSIAPWLWFKLYWAAWALLLAVATILIWARGREPGPGPRLRLARRRFTRATAGVAALAVALILGFGGFVYYNTNVLNEYRSTAESVERQAEYERRYGRYEGSPQPRVAGTSVNVEIHPDRGQASFRGTYRLVNEHAAPIDSIHVETPPSVQTRVAFDGAAVRVHADEELRHDIYALAEPLQPGDTLTMRFEVDFARRGFRNSGASNAVVPNGTSFTDGALPVIGYRSSRELIAADDRRRHGLPRRVTFPRPDDVDPTIAAGEGGVFEAIVGTAEGQVAVAPGELRRTWTEGGRRYFHYASDVPITGQALFFSADYAVRRDRWNDVEISVFHHPGHARNIDRLIGAARASLDYNTSQFGPYPFGFLQLVEQPSSGFGMGVDGSGVVTILEGALLLNPKSPGLDAVSEILAHEMGHQWWGVQLRYAYAEGAIVLSEGLAWYSAMQIVRKTMGQEQLRRFMHQMRQPYPWPPIRTGLPLLRAMDPYAGYRKAPFALFALSEYVGEERVNGALATLLRAKGASSPSQATTLDLYRELQAVTPDSLQSLLHDLFAVNTFWTFDTKQATAVQTGTGNWQVTFEVTARKVVADSAGKETELPMTEWVEIGIFAAAAPGEILGRPLYVRKHRIRSGVQTITVTLPQRPARGGIDPYNLLDWEEGDNIGPIDVVSAGRGGAPAG